MSDALFNQKLWSEPVLHYLYSRILQSFSKCCILHTFPNDSLCCFHLFPAVILLLRWICPGRLSRVSILWCTQPFWSWEPCTGAPGTSGCSQCWWFCFGSWDFTCTIWASGSSFGPSQFLLQSKSYCPLFSVRIFLHIAWFKVGPLHYGENWWLRLMLRAQHAGASAGTENKDWIQSPVIWYVHIRLIMWTLNPEHDTSICVSCVMPTSLQSEILSRLCIFQKNNLSFWMKYFKMPKECTKEAFKSYFMLPKWSMSKILLRI